MDNIIKCRFLRDGEPVGKEYSYLTRDAVSIGDVVQAETQKGAADLIVTALDVPGEEVESFKDRLKYITVKSECRKSNVESLE